MPRPKRTGRPTATVGIQLDAPVMLHQALASLARQHDRSLAGECLAALREYCRANGHALEGYPDGPAPRRPGKDG